MATASMIQQEEVEVNEAGEVIIVVPSTSSSNSSSSSSKKLFTKDSDLSDLNRRICVVTTASIPWLTGTAVNPLMRALYLTRGRPKDYVTLIIPWLTSLNQRQQLYSETLAFEDGKHQQEEWIRNWCCSKGYQDEQANLQISFYNSTYQNVFKSIFPTQDICALIPNDQADIAILEEPEHLNWFRVLPSSPSSLSPTIKLKSIMAVATSSSPSKSSSETPQPSPPPPQDNTTHHIGWAQKFRHVVGILHTNYGAYVRQYGLGGTSLLTAPALDKLSALVVRAYCHRIIRLSPTLPSLCADKEVTSNVHGVRSDFLKKTQSQEVESSESKPAEGDPSSSSSKKKNAPVYFVGKIIWAKGFDDVLLVQEKFKLKSASIASSSSSSPPPPSSSKDDDSEDAIISNNEYFAMDLYGKGDDQKAIQRAFFGRKHDSGSGSSHDNNNNNDNNSSSISDSSGGGGGGKSTEEEPSNGEGDSSSSSDAEDSEGGGGGEGAESKSPKEVSSSTTPTKTTTKTTGTTPLLEVGMETAEGVFRLFETVVQDLLAPLSEKTSSAVASVKKSDDDNDNMDVDGDANKMQHNSNNNNNNNKERGQKDQHQQNKLSKTKTTIKKLVPQRARHKWRRTPLPARFLGVQDHVILREIPETYIFLNMSTSEVLCTTSAEALAMGKWVILPKHPSNEFFCQFPNCLSYNDVDDCVDKLQYALAHKPEPLSDKFVHILSWEGATERLYAAAGITEEQVSIRKTKGLDEKDLKAAKFHMESTRKSLFVPNLLRGVRDGAAGLGKKLHRSLSPKRSEDEEDDNEKDDDDDNDNDDGVKEAS